jgi:hypothetical protein
MKKQMTKWETLNAKNNIRFLCWTLAWAVTMVLADKAELYGWHSSSMISIIAIVVNTGLGLGMIMAFMRFLKGMDELQQKIQLNSLAMSVGVGIVGGFTYSLLATANFIADAEASDVLLIMSVTYMVGVMIGQIRLGGKTDD